MSDQWFYARSGQQFGPVTFEEVRGTARNGVLGPDDYVWSSGMADWKPARDIDGLFDRPNYPPGPPPTTDAPSASDLLTLKIAASVTAILFGYLGVHKFILGMKGPGLIMLLVTVLTFGAGAVVMYPIGLIEGIIYLVKSDEDFYRDYMVNKKGWF